MKIRIKTAHGYLSAQPDGTWQYRTAAGSWEEFDVEGLTLPTPGPGPDPPPPGGDPTLPAEENAQYVARVKAQCQALGLDLSGGCGAFEIAKRVAWGLRAKGYGLLSKPGGNNCQAYATDIVMQNNGSGAIIDVLGDGGGNNTPIWVQSDVVDPARWRPPVQP